MALREPFTVFQYFKSNFMKRHLFSLLLCLIGATGFAQTNEKSREVGLQFSNLDLGGNNSFSAFYKKQIKENTYRRFRATAGSAGFITSDGDIDQFSIGLSLAAGREKRKQLDRKLSFYRGFEIQGSTNYQTINGTDFIGLGLRGGLVFGLQHQFNEFWAINLETIPGLGVNLNGTDGNWRSSVNAGFSNQVSIGILRRF